MEARDLSSFTLWPLRDRSATVLLVYISLYNPQEQCSLWDISTEIKAIRSIVDQPETILFVHHRIRFYSNWNFNHVLPWVHENWHQLHAEEARPTWHSRNIYEWTTVNDSNKIYKFEWVEQVGFARRITSLRCSLRYDTATFVTF